MLCSVLTRDYGKRGFILKGLRKSRKRPQSVKEPGTVISLVYYFHPDRNLHIINECGIVESRREFHEDLGKIYTLSFILETVDKTTGEGTGETGIYPLLSGAIDTLAGLEEHVFLTAFFLIRLLKIYGLLPPFGVCAECGQRNPEKFHLMGADLKQLCERCAPPSWNGSLTRTAGPGYFSRLTERFIMHAQSYRFSKMPPEGYSAVEAKKLVLVLVGFLEGYFHIRINSKKFILSE